MSWMRHVFSVGGSKGTTGTYANKHGVVHQTVTLRKVDSRGVVCIGRPETRESWFPEYSWQITYCSICSDHACGMHAKYVAYTRNTVMPEVMSR